ncbi:MAG: AAA family ATPase [Planctomycetes bacterium]|nr:AAA family ATPase [Planctomycetota bacterium]
MPITSLRLKNFKCFADTEETQLAPLTVVFGRNNAGKSSLLQGLALLRQTLDNPQENQRLALEGTLYPAGSYADLVHGHRKTDHISIAIGVKTLAAAGSVEFEFTCDDLVQSPKLVRMGILMRGQAPVELRRGVGYSGPFVLFIDRKRQGYSKAADFHFPASGILPIIGSNPTKVGRPSRTQDRARKKAPLLLSALEKELRGIRAVGSFRAQPERTYGLKSPSVETVDITGADVVQALIADSTAPRKRGNLVHAVNRWLKVIGRVRILQLRSSSRGRRSYEVRMKDLDSGRWAHFCDVGFGIGQALPVVVEGLRTPASGTFVVQEPEIHLHPDAQLAMADFLIDLVLSGKRVIVETHSENLLLRIRHRILTAAGNGRRGSSLAPSDVAVIQVDRAGKGESKVRTIGVDDLGQMADWPSGFMQEANDERMKILHEMGDRMEKAR